MKKSTPRIEVKPLEEAATPDPHNVNKHTQRGRGLLENELRKRGAFRSIASAGKGVDVPVVYAGNLTLETAASAGFKEVVNVFVEGDQLVNVVRTDIAPNSPEAVALGISDNEIGKQSYNPDIDTLAALVAGDNALLAELRKQDEVFDGMVREMGLNEESADAEPQINRAEELNKKWKVETGDLWLIGEHRLICGDCTDKAVVDRVMQGEKAQIMFTDPPYGVDYTGGHFHSGNVNIKRERERLEADIDTAIYWNFLPVAKQFVDGACYMWFAGSRGRQVYDAVEDCGFEIHALIVWHKINATYAAMNAQYKQRHEPCLYFKPKGSILRWTGASDECTLWEVKRDAVNKFHPTQKPVELAQRAIGNHDAPIVLDMFSGSGSTLVACQNLNRKCRAIEISPAYCAVILERMSQAFPNLEIRKA